LKRLQTV